MNSRLFPRGTRLQVLCFLFLVLVVSCTPAHAQAPAAAPEPAVFLNFEEGSGMYALDGSGHGNAAALHNVTRINSGGCSRALLFTNPDSYVAIPYRVLNHPADEITVSAWFYADNITPAALVSAYHDGGYRLGFGDGNDLWWTVSLDAGDVSVPVRHENIAPGQWHQVTGTYDGKILKIYLDGILRNQVEATGSIRYGSQSYVILGAEAGPDETPGTCPRYFAGGLDDVRIYPKALSYSQVMDDRFRCIEGEKVPAGLGPAITAPDTCRPVSGSVLLGTNETAERVLSFADKTVNGTWEVTLRPGSVLRVYAFDSYAKASPDAWYLEIADENGRPARTIAFPGRNNAPAEAMLPSGNATVTVRYFSGDERFPATVLVRFESLAPEPPRPIETKNILANPIIVIYSASWATLVAILLVMIWLRWRRKQKKTGADEPVCPPAEEKKL